MAKSQKKGPKKSSKKSPKKSPKKVQKTSRKVSPKTSPKANLNGARARNSDGFMVEEDGRVELMLELSFERDPKVRVSPEVAKRIMDGEFDGQDVTDIPGIEVEDVLNEPIRLDGVVEVYPPPPDRGKKSSSNDGPHLGSDADDGHVESQVLDAEEEEEDDGGGEDELVDDEAEL
jgi:hypothetical protein